jgi:hypothetical protein
LTKWVFSRVARFRGSLRRCGADERFRGGEGVAGEAAQRGEEVGNGRVQIRRDLLHEAIGDCFLGGEQAGGEQQLHRAPLTDEMDQPLRAAPTARQPIFHLGERETGVRGAETDIAGGQNFAAAAVCVPVDCADDGDGQFCNFLQGLAHDPVQADGGFGFRMAGKLFQVCTGGEGVAAAAGDHQSAQILVCCDLIDQCGKPFLQMPIEGVAGVRAVEADDGRFIADCKLKFFTHGQSVSRSGREGKRIGGEDGWKKASGWRQKMRLSRNQEKSIKKLDKTCAIVYYFDHATVKPVHFTQGCPQKAGQKGRIR